MARYVAGSEYRLTDHARAEMVRRGISEAEVARILRQPEQVLAVREGREVLQSLVRVGRPEREYLLRVFVDLDREPVEVVTVYRTSRIRKYWRDRDEGHL